MEEDGMDNQDQTSPWGLDEPSGRGSNRSPPLSSRRIWMIAPMLISLIACGGPGSGPSTITSTIGAPGTQPEGTVPVEGPPIPPIDTCSLITIPELDEALGLLQFPVSERSFFTSSRGETCTWDHEREGVTRALTIEPGDPGDFDPGASLLGVTGVAVTGVGDLAIWFGTAEAGAMSVIDETPMGYVLVRVILARPDLDDVGRIATAEQVATMIIERLATSGGIVVSRDDEPGEPVSIDLVDHLNAEEQSGEWTRAEGLVTILRLLAGEIDAAEVVRSSVSVDLGPELVVLAGEYVLTGADEAARVEIARLLDRLVMTRDELEQISEPDSPPDATEGLMMYLGSFLAQSQEPSPGYCSDVMQTSSPCLVKETATELEAQWPNKYAIYRPKGDLNSGWDLRHIDATREAMVKSATLFEPLGSGTMPAVSIFLTQYDHWKTQADPDCVISVPAFTQTEDGGRFRQALAFRMAMCLLHHKFAGDTADEVLLARWWFKATAIYLSGVLYGDANGEHVLVPSLEGEELGRGLLSRVDTNWIFFEHLHQELGPQGITSLLANLPGSLHTEFAASWHPFNQALTDVRVEDLGETTGVVPFNPRKVSMVIDGPGEASFDVSNFGVNRLEVQVVGGKSACVDYRTDNQLVASWRAGTVGQPGGGWSAQLPETVRGESVFLITATRTAESGPQLDSTLTIQVTKVVDDPEECTTEDEETQDPCPLGDICLSVSNFYRYLEQLGASVRQLLSDATSG
jgi:hypothetical protein